EQARLVSGHPDSQLSLAARHSEPRDRLSPDEEALEYAVDHGPAGHDRASSSRLNVTTHTHGLESHGWPRLALMSSQRSMNQSRAASSWTSCGYLSVPGMCGWPSALASSGVMSWRRSTRTPVTSSVRRLAQRGMWMGERR